MISLISDNKDAIARLCREYGIKRLDVFGSAATGAFNPESSDVDFVVDLGEYDRGVAWRYLGLCEALETLLGYSVEMVTEPSIRNPYFREAVEEQRTNVYVASNIETAA